MSIKKDVGKLGAAVLMAGTLAACSGSDEDSATLAQIEGIWGNSNSDDVSYTVVDANGRIAFYDYQSDSAGTGENCFVIDTIPELTSMSFTPNGSAYNLEFASDQFTGILVKAAVVEGNTLSLWELDENSARLGSDPTTVFMMVNENVAPETVQRVEGISVTDLNLCSNSAVIQNDDSGASIKQERRWLSTALRVLLQD